MRLRLWKELNAGISNSVGKIQKDHARRQYHLLAIKAKQHFSFHFKAADDNLDESLVWQEDALHFSFHFKATIFEHENGTFATSLKHVPSPKAEPPDEYFKQQSS